MNTYKVLSKPEIKGMSIESFEICSRNFLGTLSHVADLNRVVAIYNEANEDDLRRSLDMKILYDFYPPPLKPKIIEMIFDELKLSYNMGFNDFNSRHEAYAVLKEEVDEVWDKIKRDSLTEFLDDEVIQVAAMAIKFLIYIEKFER